MRRQETGSQQPTLLRIWGGEGHAMGANTRAPSPPHLRDVVHPMTTGISEGVPWTRMHGRSGAGVAGQPFFDQRVREVELWTKYVVSSIFVI